MNHAKLETYRIFDASIVPVCTGGLRVPDSGFRAALRRKVADTRPGSWGAPQRQGASDGGAYADRAVNLYYLRAVEHCQWLAMDL